MMILHIYVDLDLRRTSVDFGSKGQRSDSTYYFGILQTRCYKSKVICPGFVEVCKTGYMKIFSISPANDVWGM